MARVEETRAVVQDVATLHADVGLDRPTAVAEASDVRLWGEISPALPDDAPALEARIIGNATSSVYAPTASAFQACAGSSTTRRVARGSVVRWKSAGSTLPAETMNSREAPDRGPRAARFRPATTRSATPAARASSDADHSEGCPGRSGGAVTGMQKTRGRATVASGIATACAVTSPYASGSCACDRWSGRIFTDSSRCRRVTRSCRVEESSSGRAARDRPSTSRGSRVVVPASSTMLCTSSAQRVLEQERASAERPCRDDRRRAPCRPRQSVAPLGLGELGLLVAAEVLDRVGQLRLAGSP